MPIINVFKQIFFIDINLFVLMYPQIRMFNFCFLVIINQKEMIYRTDLFFLRYFECFNKDLMMTLAMVMWTKNVSEVLKVFPDLFLDK
jgi:hypothetical protein